MNLFQAYHLTVDLTKSKKKLLTNQGTGNHSGLLGLEDGDGVVGETIVRDASTLYEIVTQQWHSNKKIAVVGEHLHGKSAIIGYLKTYIERKQKRKINLHSIYFTAFRNPELLSATDKHQGILPRCLESPGENWVVLDGPLTGAYSAILASLSNEPVLANFGAVHPIPTHTPLRIFLETNNLGGVAPNFVGEHSVLYLQEKEKRIEQILRCAIENFSYRSYEEHSRLQLKNEQTHHQVRTYHEQHRPPGLPKQTRQLLIMHIAGLIDKFVSKGSFKIKAVQLMYEITAAELAYRCSKLIEAVLRQNREYFRESRDKIPRKTVERFAGWVVVWSVFAVVRPQDKEKFEKGVAELLKSVLVDDFLNLIVYPGNGLQLLSLGSPRVQSVFSCVPIPGDILNVQNRYNALFELNSFRTKNKYEHQFYFDDPHSIRAVTREAALFTYFASLTQGLGVPFFVYGPGNSGKKAVVEIFNKGKEDKIRNYSIRFKKHDPYHIATQLLKPFTRFEAPGGCWMKALDSTKQLHVTIDDVAMVPEVEPALEYLRMLANTHAAYDEKAAPVHFRDFMMTVTGSQIKEENYEKVDFKRLLARMFVVQSAKVTTEKLFTIYHPILENFCCDFWTTNNCYEKVRAFNNKNGDNILVQATLSIYCFVEEIVSELPCSSTLDRNKKLLIAPKIKDLINAVANICHLGSSESVDVEGCAQLWAHEMLRVFSDKLPSQQHQRALSSQIKKYSFMHFKHNITPSGLIFTTLGCSPNEKEEEPVYGKCHDLSKIEKEIQTVLESMGLSLAIPIVTDEFIEELMKVHRVLRMQSCHLLIASPYKRSSKYLIKIATLLIEESVCHDIEQEPFDFQLHIAPAIFRDIPVVLLFDIELSSQESLYTLSCLMNRNNLELDIKPQTKDKIREKFLTIVQDSLGKESELLLRSSLGKSKLTSTEGGFLDGLRLTEAQSKIELEFVPILVDCFSEHLHVATCVLPHSPTTTKFLSENVSITKHMQVLWYEWKEETLYLTGQRMLEQISETGKHPSQLANKCRTVYQLLSGSQKNQADFLRFLGTCSRTYEIASEEVGELVKIYEGCLRALSANAVHLSQLHKDGEEIQLKIEELARSQEVLSGLMKTMEENGEEDTEELDASMKRIKNEKDALDLRTRELRTSEKLCEDLEKVLPGQAELGEQLTQAREVRDNIEQYSIIVEAAFNYLNNAAEEQYLSEFNRWAAALGIPQVSTVSQVLHVFEKIIGIDYVRVPGWQKFSEFTQLKGIHFCQNFLSIQQSAFGLEPIVTNDNSGLLKELLSSFGEKNHSLNVYGNYKLVAYLNKEEMIPKDDNKKTTREQIYSTLEKYIEQIMNENREHREPNNTEDKNVLSKGVIIVGENCGWRPTRNELDIFERRLLKDKKLQIQNRIIIEGGPTPNITFHSTPTSLLSELRLHSLRIQFGQGFLLENLKLQTFLREVTIKLDRKKQDLIIACTAVLESQEKNMDGVIKIQNQIGEIEKAEKKAIGMVPEQYRKPNDEFLVQWFFGVMGNGNIRIQRAILPIFQTIKRNLMQHNFGKETKATSINELPPETVLNWEALIRANILGGEGLQISSLMSHCIKIDKIPTAILIPAQPGIENQLRSLQLDSPYTLQFVSMQCGPLCDAVAPQHSQPKNLLVLLGFVGQASCPHSQWLIEHLERYTDLYCPVVVIVSDDCEGVTNNGIIKNRFRVVVKEIEMRSNNSNFLLELSNVQVEEQPNTKKLTLTDSVGGVGETVRDSHTTANSRKTVLKQKARKLLLILMCTQSQKGNNSSLEQLPLKTVHSRIKQVTSASDARSLILDCIPELPQEWEQLLGYVTQCVSPQHQEMNEQIQLIFGEYIAKIQSGELPLQTRPSYKQKPSEFIPNPTQQQIDNLLDRLPFSFNFNDFADTCQPFNIELIGKARLLNKERHFLKKYLQDCARIVRGLTPNYWTPLQQFGLQLPTASFITQLNTSYKILKKALEMAGLISSIDSSNKDIRLNNSMGFNQTQAILSLACLSCDCRNLEGITEKLLLSAVIKASKRLKVPFGQLKTSWKLISPEGTVEWNVIGDACLSMNSSVSKQHLLSIQRARLPRQPKKVKLLMMIYDPTPPSVQVQPAPKLQLKKQKSKKYKDEKMQSVSFEKQTPMYPVPVKERYGKKVGVIPVPIDDDNLRYKVVIEEPQFLLF